MSDDKAKRDKSENPSEVVKPSEREIGKDGELP